ncbi:MAG: acetate kinase [Eubacteriales bacterium]|nr:acetate kinase [Eubacteriales bacterium]
MNILVINSGSSSLKYQLLDFENKIVMAKGVCERIGIGGSLFSHSNSNGYKIKKENFEMNDHRDAAKRMVDALLDPKQPIIASLKEIHGIGHRVVHGGPIFSEPAIVTEEVKESIRKTYAWGPLHNPANMMGIEACEKLMPGVPQVCVFDTAFHQTLPEEAYMYGLPYRYYEEHQIRRYGFHGTSHMFVSMRCAELTKFKSSTLKLVSCHLGNGSSFAAIKGGKSIDTSMGLTPLAGIIMGTRCGDIDPAIVPFIANLEKKTAAEIDEIMNSESGVKGISGVSSDFRDLENAADAGNERAKLALSMFYYQASKIIASYAAVLNGLEALVFTAGIGENDPKMRQSVCDRLAFLGVKLDPEANKVRGKEMKISTEDSAVEVFVIPTNEELSIARQTVEMLDLDKCKIADKPQ